MLLFVAGCGMAGTAAAQANMVTFKHFHRYPPSGLWSQELTGTRNGVSTGAPIQSTSCTGVADPKSVAQLQKLGEANPASCNTVVITDTESLAVYERTCTVGGATQVTRSTMKALDDKTLTIDTRDDIPGFMQTAMHSKVTYLGACTATAYKPSAEECAELATAAQDPAASETQCAQLPAAYQAQCQSRIAAGRKAMDAMRAQCQ